jgi:hypothetical protein
MMRTFIIFFLSLIITGTLDAQGVSTAIASATIVSEVGVTDLEENNVISFDAAKNDVQPVNSDRISILSKSKTVEILFFKVISNENNFSITIPPTFHFIKKGNVPGDMTAELFITPSENKKNTQLISLTSVFKKNNFQAPGNYSSSPLEITVNYN